MTRIIGGSARGRRLQTPPGQLTRPTSDRVREALFSTLESRLGSLSGLDFLDLYAGSGAVGLEALSRGAASATLVEQDRRTVGVIRANLTALGLQGGTIAGLSVSRFLGGAPSVAFDAVFADPPYSVASEEVEGNLAALAGPGWLAPDAVVVVERSSRGGAFGWPPGFVVIAEKAYGETTLGYARWPGMG